MPCYVSFLLWCIVCVLWFQVLQSVPRCPTHRLVFVWSTTWRIPWPHWLQPTPEHEVLEHNVGHVTKLRLSCYLFVIAKAGNKTAAVSWPDPCTQKAFNSLMSCDTYMRQWDRSSLVQLMTCCLFDAKPLCEPMLTSCQLDLKENISLKFYWKLRIFDPSICIWKYHLKNVAHLVSASMC